MRTNEPCCDELAAMQRQVSRRGLMAGAMAMAGVSTVVGSAVLTASPAQARPADSILVVLSLRGAADGLSLVVPHADPQYYKLRPKLGIPADRLWGRDDMFGLHPSLKSLEGLWNAHEMAVVHATGLPVANRSHFSAMEEMEDADPGSPQRIGWLNRLVGTTSGNSPLQGFNASGSVVPSSLAGPRPTVGAGDAKSLALPGDDRRQERRRALRTLWRGSDLPLRRSLFDAIDAVDDFVPVRDTQDNTTSYPGGDLGQALSTTARIIRGDVGVEVITVDHGDWDMHVGLGTTDGGRMKENAAELADGLKAFFADLGSYRQKVTLVVLSEFGRTAEENSSSGTDHGYGNAMFVLGAGVKGGYYGRWPGLRTGSEKDLRVTTDYRNVLADVVTRRFDTTSARIFPGFRHKPVGFMKG